MRKPLVEAVSASQAKVGTMVKWPTPGGTNHGVVVGMESADLLVLTVYGKGSKSDPMVKKYRDEALTAKLTSPNPKLVMDIQRVPASKATAQERLTGAALRPYTQASQSLGEGRNYGPLATLLQRLGEELQAENSDLKIITSILDDADEPKYSAKDVAMKGVATLKAKVRSEKDPKTRKASKGAEVEVTDESGYDDASGKLLSDKIFRLFGKDHVLVDFGKGDRDLVRTDYVVLESTLHEGQAADVILAILKDTDSVPMTDLARDKRLKGVHFAKIQSAAKALVKAKKIISKDDVLTLA
jgi:hypothetical protein